MRQSSYTSFLGRTYRVQRLCLRFWYVGMTFPVAVHVFIRKKVQLAMSKGLTRDASHTLYEDQTVWQRGQGILLHAIRAKPSSKFLGLTQRNISRWVIRPFKHILIRSLHTKPETHIRT